MRVRAPRGLWRRASLAAAVCVGACSDPATPEDAARFDAREVIIAPADVAASDAASDLAPTVDVTLYDSVTSSDVARPDDGAQASDAIADPCRVLAESYAAAVRAAQSCAGDTACGAAVCETLCCVCRVYVDPRSDGYARLATLRASWESSGCAATARCESTPCEEPTGAVCSTEGLCVTLRRTPRDAAVSLPDVGGAERDGGALVADASGGDASALDESGAAARDGGVDVTSVDSRDGGSR